MRPHLLKYDVSRISPRGGPRFFRVKVNYLALPSTAVLVGVGRIAASLLCKVEAGCANAERIEANAALTRVARVPSRY